MKLSLSTVEVFKHVRSDMLVELTNEQLVDLQRVLLEIVEDIERFCQKNGIRYFLGGGSALGAIRHQGIIPWDDDIDLNMMRSDYERFIEMFPQEMGNKYWLHTPEKTKGYALQLARVRMKETSVKTREDFFCDECGAFVDIFVIENIPDNPLLRVIHGTGSMGLGFLLSCRKFFHERKHLKRLLADNRDLWFSFVVKTAIGAITAILPIEGWVYLNYKWNGLYKNTETRCLTVPAGRNHYWKEILERKDIIPERRAPFNGQCLPVYHNVERYLEQLYGRDYMIPPTKDKLEKHILFPPFILKQ